MALIFPKYLAPRFSTLPSRFAALAAFKGGEGKLEPENQIVRLSVIVLWFIHRLRR